MTRKGRPMTHGGRANGKRTGEYNTWRAMKARCYYLRHKSYPDYGGRGITICAEWIHSFEKFRADVGERPEVEWTLDRIDPEGNYEPGNVRWASKTTQRMNQRRVEEEVEVEDDDWICPF